MKKLFLLLIVGFFLGGCGMGMQNEAEEKTNGGKNQMNEKDVVPALIKHSPFVYEYQIENNSETVIEFSFTSSQRFDFSISTKEGEQVYLFSSTASFLQVLGEEKLKPGEQLSYDIEFKKVNLSAGEYILTVWLTTSEGEKYKVNQEFTV